MILIFGGAYQGKLAYARDRFGVIDADIYHYSEEKAAAEDIPGHTKIFNGTDKWILALIKAEVDVDSAIRRFIDTNPEGIVICTDISCGIVPISAVERKWREAVGRAMAELSKASSEVVRVFCGIPTRIK